MTTIIRLTILEATRKRLIWALLLLTMLVVGLTGWGVSLLVTNARANGVPESQIQFGVSQVVILLASVGMFCIGATAVSNRDNQNWTAYRRAHPWHLPITIWSGLTPYDEIERK